MLSLVQQAAGELGLAVPTVVVGNTNTDTIQQLALLNSVGKEISRQYIWQALNKQNIITVSTATVTGTTAAGSATLTTSNTGSVDATYQISGPGINQATYITGVSANVSLTLSQIATSANTNATYTLSKVKYTMPTDYDRQIDNTHWDKSKHWQMLGPETAQQWEWLISGYISTGPRIRYRIFGGYFQIWPQVTINEVLGFEYVSNGWASSSSGTAQSAFLADTDTCIYPDSLMVTGLKLKYAQAKEFDGLVASYARDYQIQLDIAKANDAGSATLSMCPRVNTILIGWDQIPDSGYGS